MLVNARRSSGSLLVLDVLLHGPAPNLHSVCGPCSRIPHTLLDPEEGIEICVFAKDPARELKDKLLAVPVPGVTKVIGVSKLKKNYHEFKDRRTLASSYDAFFADERVIRMMPKLLGKTFYEKKKAPVPVRVDGAAAAVAKELAAARDSTYAWVGWGQTTSMRVGRSNMTPEQVADNVMAAVEPAVAHMPRKWRNVQSVYLQAANTVGLPVYKALPALNVAAVVDSDGEDDVDGGELEAAGMADALLLAQGGATDSEGDEDEEGDDVGSEVDDSDDADSDADAAPARAAKPSAKRSAVEAADGGRRAAAPASAASTSASASASAGSKRGSKAAAAAEQATASGSKQKADGAAAANGGAGKPTARPAEKEKDKGKVVGVKRKLSDAAVDAGVVGSAAPVAASKKPTAGAAAVPAAAAPAAKPKAAAKVEKPAAAAATGGAAGKRGGKTAATATKGGAAGGAAASAAAASAEATRVAKKRKA